MSIDRIVVIIFSLVGIAFTFWFFLMRKEKEAGISDSIDIIVDGGYNPEIIAIPLNKKTILNFTRKDSNSCLEEVVLSDFKIKKFLPLNKKVTVQITPEKKGEFVYSCSMNMFHGKIKVI